MDNSNINNDKITDKLVETNSNTSKNLHQQANFFKSANQESQMRLNYFQRSNISLIDRNINIFSRSSNQSYQVSSRFSYTSNESFNKPDNFNFKQPPE